MLVGGRYDLLAQRERVFDPFGALAGEPTASLSKGIKGYFSPRAGILFRPFDDTQLFAALRPVADPQHRRAHSKRRSAAAAAGHTI